MSNTQDPKSNEKQKGPALLTYEVIKDGFVNGVWKAAKATVTMTQKQARYEPNLRLVKSAESAAETKKPTAKK